MGHTQKRSLVSFCGTVTTRPRPVFYFSLPSKHHEVYRCLPCRPGGGCRRGLGQEHCSGLVEERRQRHRGDGGCVGFGYLRFGLHSDWRRATTCLPAITPTSRPPTASTSAPTSCPMRTPWSAIPSTLLAATTATSAPRSARPKATCTFTAAPSRR